MVFQQLYCSEGFIFYLVVIGVVFFQFEPAILCDLKNIRHILWYNASNIAKCLHCKKRLAIFPSSAGISLIKLSLAGNNQIISPQGEFG